MTVWNLVGTAEQNALVQSALDRCDMDWTKLLPSLQREGKTSIRVEWADLSRYAGNDDDAEAHEIVREVEGRARVLGLFYLPPYTKVVLDRSLTGELAREVFLAEGAHAVDYHYLSAEDRRAFVNSLHTQQLPAGTTVVDGLAFQLDGHTCSWFDVGPYGVWNGEALMEAFIEATSDVPVTINLSHDVGAPSRAVVREILGLTSPAAPEPHRVYLGMKRSKVVHDAHDGIAPVDWFDSLTAAQDAGLRACRVCRPS